MSLNEKYKTLLNNSGINTPLRVAHFMAQIDHESHLNPVQENLNYSAQGLLKTFPKYFNEKTVNGYARFPEAIANVVYANRMGNGDYNSKDGWKYRGRGFIQLTGKSNYQSFKNDSGIDVISNPDLLLEEANAMICAVWFWNNKGLNIWADKDDIETITNRINGGLNGLGDRKALLSKWKTILNYKAIIR